MTFEDKSVAVKLEDVVSCSNEDLTAFRKIVFDAMFSANREDRMSNVFELNELSNRCLRRGYYERGHIFLNVNSNGTVVNVDVGAVPKEYMDVGHHGFEL